VSPAMARQSYTLPQPRQLTTGRSRAAAGSLADADAAPSFPLAVGFSVRFVCFGLLLSTGERRVGLRRSGQEMKDKLPTHPNQNFPPTWPDPPALPKHLQGSLRRLQRRALPVKAATAAAAALLLVAADAIAARRRYCRRSRAQPLLVLPQLHPPLAVAGGSRRRVRALFGGRGGGGLGHIAGRCAPRRAAAAAAAVDRACGLSSVVMMCLVVVGGFSARAGRYSMRLPKHTCCRRRR
jgi:hypothetical protein